MRAPQTRRAGERGAPSARGARPRSLRVLVVTAATALVTLLAPPARLHAQDAVIPAMGNRDLAFVGGTAAFRFHSDFWLNLHTYLYGVAGGGPDPRAGFEAENSECFAALADEAAGWQIAEAFYVEQMGERHHRADPLMRSIRYGIAGLAQEHDPGDELAAVMSLLRGAAPAYRACLWERHDARNRARIADLLDTVVRFGPAIQAELSAVYQTPWPQAVVVDVAGYTDFAGANTASGATLPGHMMLSSVRESTEGFNGFELLHHEASHLIFGSRWGTVGRLLTAAGDELGVRPPRELWHAINFYTAGEAATRIVRIHGDPDFLPHATASDMWSWAFPGMLEPLQTHWERYLRGEVGMYEALREVVASTVEE